MIPVWRRAGRALKAVARRIGQAQSWLLLTLFYFLFLAPVALVYRCVADPLRLGRRARDPWCLREPVLDQQRWARIQ